MILTGPEIRRAVDAGDVVITPWNDAHLGANSYDVTLGPLLTTYKTNQHVLDPWQEIPTDTVKMTDAGMVLRPGRLYLGHTVETACSRRHVPMLEGRSSIGRLGVSIHATAGFGDVGWGFAEDGSCTLPTWTLEISVLQPVRLYPGMRVGQVYFVQTVGERAYYRGRYQDQRAPEPCRLWRDVV